MAMSGLASFLDSYLPFMLVLVVAFFLVTVLMYSCARKFTENKRSSSDHAPCDATTTDNPASAALSQEANGPLAENDSKKRRRRNKKARKRKDEGIEHGGLDQEQDSRLSQELIKNAKNTRHRTSGERASSDEHFRTNERAKISSEHRDTARKGKESRNDKPARGDESDVKSKKTTNTEHYRVERRLPEDTRHCTSGERTSSDEYSRTHERAKKSEDANAGSERKNCDDFPRRRGKNKGNPRFRRRTLSDHSSEQDSERRLPENPRYYPMASHTGTPDHEVNKTEHPDQRSKASRENATSSPNVHPQVPHQRVPRRKSTDSNNSSTAQPENAAGSSGSTRERGFGRQGRPSGLTIERRRKEEDSGMLKTTKVLSPAEVVAEQTRGRGTEDQQKFGKQNCHGAVTIEVKGRQDEQGGGDQKRSVTDQEKSSSPLAEKDAFTRTSSLDSGYSEETVSPTWEASESSGVFGSLSDTHAPQVNVTQKTSEKMRSTRLRTKSAGEAKVFTKTERAKQTAKEVESIIRTLQFKPAVNEVAWTAETPGRVDIDPEVRERIANPKHRVRMPDEPVEHLGFFDATRKFPGAKSTNMSRVNGLFGRRWKEKREKELEREDSEEEDWEDDPVLDLRDDTCPSFMIWGECPRGDRCEFRHPSYRYLDRPTRISARLPREETKRNPSCYAAVLEKKKKSEFPEVFSNDGLAPQDNTAVGENELSYSKALFKGGVEEQQGRKLSTGVERKESCDEAWPALGSPTQHSKGREVPQVQKSSHAAQKGSWVPDLDSENTADRLQNVYGQSTDELEDTEYAQWDYYEYQEGDWYETVDYDNEDFTAENETWPDFEQENKHGQLESSTASEPVISTEDSAVNGMAPLPAVSLGPCDICMDRPKDATLACGHRFCYMCALQMRLDERVCAICRRCIVSVIKTYN